MKHKFRNLCMISFLAIAGIFGISSTIINNKTQDTPIAEKAEASYTYHTIYFATTNQRSNYYARVRYAGDDNDDRGDYFFSEVGKSGNYYIYSASVYEKYNGLGGMWIRYGTGGEGGTWVTTPIDYKVWTPLSTFEGKVWYSDAWKSIYTVTYQPNGGNGSTKTDYKIEDVDYTILTYANAGMSAKGARYCSKWHESSSGGTGGYQPGNTYSTNNNLTLYLIQEDYTYEFSVDGGSNWVRLTKTEPPSGFARQFSASGQTFTSGQIISFHRFKGTDTPSSVSIGYDSTDTSNNLNTATCAILYSIGSGSVHLKVKDDGSTYAHIDGFSARGVCIYRDSYNYNVPGSFDESTAGEQNQQYIITSIEIHPGDKLKEVYNGNVYDTLTVENGGDYGFSSTTASAPGVFKVYLKSYDKGATFTHVWLDQQYDTASINATAVLIAKFFNDAIRPICELIEGGESPSALSTPWGTQAGYYSNISSEAQAELKNNTQGSAEISAFLARYKQVVNKRGMSNYLGLTANQLSAGSYRGIGSIFGSEDNFSTLIIIISSSVALLSVTALSILVIRKRKSKEQE